MKPKLFLLLTLTVLLPLATFPLKTAKALPAFHLTLGLRMLNTGWDDGVSPPNAGISIYKNTTVTMFLRSDDNKNHQLVINTPTPIKSPLITGGTGTVFMFSFLAKPAGIFTYCDSFNATSCGTFLIKMQGDVDGKVTTGAKPSIDIVDLVLVASKFGSSLSPNWNQGDKPYLHGRVDMTDLLVVAFYFNQVCPCAIGTPYNPDIDANNIVDVTDLQTVAANLGATAPAPFNNPNQGPDIDYDNVIDISDLGLVASHFGCTLLICDP